MVKNVKRAYNDYFVNFRGNLEIITIEKTFNNSFSIHVRTWACSQNPLLLTMCIFAFSYLIFNTYLFVDVYLYVFVCFLVGHSWQYSALIFGFALSGHSWWWMEDDIGDKGWKSGCPTHWKNLWPLSEHCYRKIKWYFFFFALLGISDDII